MSYELKLNTEYSLTDAADYFGGWLPYRPDEAAVAMAFPLEGWRGSAAVIIRQPTATTITGEVQLVGEDTSAEQGERAWRQALATLSLDNDAAGWREVGRRDPVMGRLQEQFNYLRPTIFYSPYEAASSFIIGHRISIAQTRVIRQQLARDEGTPLEIGGETLYAFPTPQRLLEIDTIKSVNAEKIERLHIMARAALDGKLDRERLRAMPVDEALAELQTLRGIGPFFAQGILMRGAGLQDEPTDEDLGKRAVQRAYNLPTLPTQRQVLEIAEAWRPYRMWCMVLLHVWFRRGE